MSNCSFLSLYHIQHLAVPFVLLTLYSTHKDKNSKMDSLAYMQVGGAGMLSKPLLALVHVTSCTVLCFSHIIQNEELISTNQLTFMIPVVVITHNDTVKTHRKDL